MRFNFDGAVFSKRDVHDARTRHVQGHFCTRFIVSCRGRRRVRTVRVHKFAKRMSPCSTRPRSRGR